MRTTLLHGGMVFDGTAGPPARADVVIADGRFVEVGTGLDGDDHLDCSGMTLLPGLFDCHIHVTVSGVDPQARQHTPFSYQFFQAAENLAKTLRLGITTARDAAGADLGIKRALQDRLIAGPRLQIAIGLISQTGGHGDGWLSSGHCIPLSLPHPGRPSAVVDGPEEMRKIARTLLRAGADVLKVCTTGGVLSPADDPRHSQFTPAELDVLVAEAAMQGRAVMAHAQGAEGIKNAVRAGIRSIEHGIYLDDEAIELMVAKKTWLVPTLIAPISVIRAGDAGVAIPQAVLSKAKEVAEVHADSVRRAHAAGVRIAMGTDSGVGPHGSNLEELGLMRDCGMSPTEVLAATTSSAARLLGFGDSLGRIEPGYRADVVMVRGDPFDLDNLAGNVAAVYQDGIAVVGGPAAPDAVGPADPPQAWRDAGSARRVVL
ncbi:MAG: amidohydrolase family protein [Sciscionella sp.]